MNSETTLTIKKRDMLFPRYRNWFAGRYLFRSDKIEQNAEESEELSKILQFLRLILSKVNQTKVSLEKTVLFNLNQKKISAKNLNDGAKCHHYLLWSVCQ